MQSFSNPVTVPSIGEQQLVRLTDEQQLILNIRGYSSRGLQLFAHSWTAATTIMPVAQVVRLLLTTVGNTSTLDKLAWFLTVGSVLGQRWLNMAQSHFRRLQSKQIQCSFLDYGKPKCACFHHKDYWRTLISKRRFIQLL